MDKSTTKIIGLVVLVLIAIGIIFLIVTMAYQPSSTNKDTDTQQQTNTDNEPSNNNSNNNPATATIKRVDKPTIRTIFPWLLVTSVVLIALIGWWSGVGWELANLSMYQIFPLFGLLAFSIMWSHYVVSHLKSRQLVGVNTKRYFAATSWVVLLLLLLHPSLLIMQRYVDGFGLPPTSYLSYVGPAGALAVVVGSLSLLAFLAFEFHRYFAGRSWWRFVEYASDAAMIGILYHSLTLGTQLRADWFRLIWYIYGIMLIYILTSKYLTKVAKSR